jgi:hypothetical protein
VPLRLLAQGEPVAIAHLAAVARQPVVTPRLVRSVRTEFCNLGRFVAFRDAAGEWQAKYPSVNVMSVADAYQMDRALSDANALKHPNLVIAREQSGGRA